MKDITEKLQYDDLEETHKKIAEIIGMENLIALADYFGGTHIYIPKKKMLLRQIRYKAIIEEFDGSNMKQLAKKYDVSEATVYRIIRQR